MDPADPEVKDNVNANVVTEKNDMLSRLDRFSSLNTAKAAVAICLRYKNNLRKKAVTKKDESMNRKPESEGRERVSASSLLSVDELQKAEMEIVKMVQSDAFPGEIKNLEYIKADSSLSNRLSDKKKKVVLKKTSALHTLDPFVDSDGILRVGGRIRRANFAQALKTPIILPKFGHLTKLVVSYIHEKTHHGGRGITMNEQRAHGYWIINGNTVVRRFISECVTCRRLRGTAGEQKMAGLPQSRLEDVPPFTYTQSITLVRGTLRMAERKLNDTGRYSRVWPVAPYISRSHTRWKRIRSYKLFADSFVAEVLSGNCVAIEEPIL